MFLSDEFIQELIHDADYDPQQRREYYLRTRELKGRKKIGIGRPSAPTVRDRERATLPFTTQPAKRPELKPKPKTSKTAEIEARVAELKARLEQLREVLRQLVKEAQIRSGADPTEAGKPGTSQKPTKKPEKTPEKLTPEQQAAQEKAAEEYYEKNKDKILADQVKDLDTKIKAIQAKIKLMREQANFIPPRTKPTTSPSKQFHTQVGSVGAASIPRVRKENSQNGRR
jgi:hypothetical protein